MRGWSRERPSISLCLPFTGYATGSLLGRAGALARDGFRFLPPILRCVDVFAAFGMPYLFRLLRRCAGERARPHHDFPPPMKHHECQSQMPSTFLYAAHIYAALPLIAAAAYAQSERPLFFMPTPLLFLASLFSLMVTLSYFLFLESSRAY